MSERLTVRDVAQVMKCSEDKVIRVFARMEGVIDLGQPENLSRRRYRVLRIPKQVVERYLTTKAGRSIRIEVPERAERRRRSPQWEARAILNLAKAGLQNGLRPDDQAHRDCSRAATPSCCMCDCQIDSVRLPPPVEGVRVARHADAPGAGLSHGRCQLEKYPLMARIRSDRMKKQIGVKGWEE